MPNYWMVRSDTNIRAHVEEEGFVAIGFGGDVIGDIGGLSREEVREQVEQRRPSATRMQIALDTGQLHRFEREIQIDDWVVTNVGNGQYLIGKVTGDYRYDNSNSGQPYRRSVEWHPRRVYRDEMNPHLKNGLGGQLTVFQLTKYGEDIDALLREGPPADQKVNSVGSDDSEELTEIAYAEDVETRARDLIADLILDPRRFGGHEFEGLVGALLQAMGFKIVREPLRGADGGIDIVVAPDVFGFEQPRIIVQVKHRQGKVGQDVVQRLVETLQPEEKGLVVSTGGFAPSAGRDLDRNITLLDGEKVVDYLIEHYENLPSEYKAKVPLKRVYLPVPPDDM